MHLFVTALIVFFTYLGEYNDYVIYKTKEDKVTLSEVVFAYNSLKIKTYRQNGRHLYYIREPNMNIFSAMFKSC
ncbi:transmembrane regulator [Salmonella enterica subsp. salamae]|uniref:Transmembrane regulator n=1 Tax=Salmonella enterica subsp. salamae TaxID=59202 RepID=A0A6D2GBL4_SALER|nr:transmembrane regulator [Salmonella enterica subsp. salamae]